MGEDAGVRRTISPTDICFNCNQQGHWYKDCPSRTATRSQLSCPVADTPFDAHDIPVVHCPCGGGICAVRISRTAKNPDRKFYTCPCGPQEVKCSFFEWCDTASSPEPEVPFCSCGAGRCSVVMKTTGPNAGRRYFACRVPKGQGACPFFQWEDAQLNGMIDNDVGESKHSDPLSTQNDQEVTRTVNVDLDDGKHANAPQDKGSNCKVSHTAHVDPSRGRHASVPQSKENDYDVTRTIYVNLGEDKHTDILSSAGCCEVTHTIYVDSGREKHVNDPQPEGTDCEVINIVNVDLSEDKHATTPINADSGKGKGDNAPKCKENGCKVTHTINDDLVEDKFAHTPQSTGNKHEATNTVNVDLGFEHSKRMRSDLPMVSSDLSSREYNLGYEHSKRMRKDLSIMGNQHYIPDLMYVSIPSAQANLQPADSSKHNEPSGIFSPSENNSDLQFVMPKISSSLDLVDVRNGDSCLSYTEIYATRDTVTGDLIVFVHEIFGFHAVGWLGRLLFPPWRFTTLPPPKPFFYGISPSFSAITVPEPMKQSDTAGPIVRPQSLYEEQCVGIIIPDMDSQFTSVQHQTVKSFRSNLVTLLKYMDPQDHKYLEQVANPILDALDHLSADNSYFRKRVEDFICCASALAQTECTSEIEPSSEDLSERYNNEKARFDDVSREQVEAMDAFKASKEVCSLLCKEASQLRTMLVEIETRLSCSEMESLKLKTRLQETCEAKTKCQMSLQSIKEELELRLRKEEEHLAAKQAFKKARNQLLL